MSLLRDYEGSRGDEFAAHGPRLGAPSDGWRVEMHLHTLCPRAFLSVLA
jgi:hypothetical protein